MRSHLVALALAFSLALVLGRAGSAHAGSVLVVDFTGTPSGPLATSPRQLSDDMAGLLKEQGAQVSQAPRDDVLALAGCPDTSDACMQQALGILQVDSMVLGQVEDGPTGGVRVQLRVIATGQDPRSATLTLAGSSPSGLEPGFRAGAGAFLNHQPLPPEAGGAPVAPAPTPTPTPPSPPSGANLADTGAGAGGFSAHRVKPYAWIVTGAGAGTLALGGLLLWAAHQKQQQVNDAPTDTVDDLNALADLESTGRHYAQWGSALAVVGGVATIVGVVIVAKQGLSSPEKPAVGRVTVSPSVTASSVGLTLTLTGGL